MTKIFEGKTINEAVEKASRELNVSSSDIHYIVVKDKETNDNFICNDSETIKISVYSINDVLDFAVEYLKNAISKLGINIEIETKIDQNENIYLNINNEKNAILIGKNGDTLKALNILLHLAVSNKFKKKIHIFLDIGCYKDRRYKQITDTIELIAKISSKQRIDIKFDAIPSDERYIVQKVLINFNDVVAEFVGRDEKQDVIIRYVGEKHTFQQNEIYYKNIIRNLDNKIM